MRSAGLVQHDDVQVSTLANRLVVSEDDDICLENTFPLLPAKELLFGQAMFMFPVFVASVDITVKLSGSLGIDLEGIVCFVSKAAGVALVPTLKAKVMLEGAISVAVLRAGISVNAVILDISLIPEAAIHSSDK